MEESERRKYGGGTREEEFFVYVGCPEVLCAMSPMAKALAEFAPAGQTL